MYLPIAIFIVAIYLAVPLPPPLGSNNPPALVVGSLALFAIGAYALWREMRYMREINPVAVTERGLYPPFKPREKLREQEWFVPYKDISSMESVTERGGLIPAYDIALRDGVKFQLNALDLLYYVSEPEVRKFEKILRVIHAELSKRENQEKASRGEDIIIPREKFRGVLS